MIKAGEELIKLQNENEQLKKQVEELKAQCINVNFSMDAYNMYRSFNKQLRAENEELEKTIGELNVKNLNLHMENARYHIVYEKIKQDLEDRAEKFDSFGNTNDAASTRAALTLIEKRLKGEIE